MYGSSDEAFENLTDASNFIDSVIILIKRALSNNEYKCNELDAVLDLTTGFICVSDNGKGIDLADILQDENWTQYGMHNFVVSCPDKNIQLLIKKLVSISKFVTIESYIKYQCGFRIIFNEGYIEQVTQFKNTSYEGSCISIKLRNYFLSPGTVEHFEMVCSRLSKNIAALYLINPQVKITISEKKFGSILSTSGSCTGMGSAFYDLMKNRNSKIIPVNSSVETMKINAFLSTDFCKTGQYQFIFVNGAFIVLELLYSELNKYLEKTLRQISIQVCKTLESDNMNLMYVLNIECSDFENFNSLETECLEACIINKVFMCLHLIIQDVLKIYKSFNCQGISICDTNPIESNNVERTISYSNTSSDTSNGESYPSTLNEQIMLEVGELFTSWYSYELLACLLNEIKPRLLDNCSSHVSHRNVKTFWENDNLLPYINCKNMQAIVGFYREDRNNIFKVSRKLDINEKIITLFLPHHLKIINLPLNYNTSDDIEKKFKLLEILKRQFVDLRALSPIKMLTYDKQSNQISNSCMNINITKCEQEKDNNDKTIQNYGKHNLIKSPRETTNSLSEIVVHSLCNEKTTFNISRRNTFIPKGSSPIMLIKDKSLIGSTNTDKNDTILSKNESLFINKYTPVEFSKEYIKGMTFSSYKKLWTIDKHFFSELEIIGQFDKKYILCAVNIKQGDSNIKNLIVLDQHAVDERIQLEKILIKFSDPLSKDHLKMHIMKKHWPLIYLGLKDLRTILKYPEYFLNKGIRFNEISKGVMAIETIPECLHWVASKKSTTSTEYYKFLRDSIKMIFEEQLAAIYESGFIKNTIPSVLHKYLCREACLEAVNFGTMLSFEQSEQLIRSISQCTLPFMCAHGRPVICFLREIPAYSRIIQYPNLQSLNK